MSERVAGQIEIEVLAVEGRPEFDSMGQQQQQKRYHFVFVHGAYHGAWCWYKLVDRLQRDGHHVTALDMAGAGLHPAVPDSIATYEEYNQPLAQFFQALPADDPSQVVVIGHSMGGLSCMQLTEQFSDKIGLVIHIAAVLTPSATSVMDCGKLTELVFVDTLASKALQYHFANGADKLPTSLSIDKPQLQEIFYTDWDSEDVVLARMLTRPVPSQMLATPIICTDEKYGQVPKVYIKCLRDNAMPVAAQDWITLNAGPFQEVVPLDGGHFHFHVKVDDFAQLVYRLTDTHFRQPELLTPKIAQINYSKEQP